MDRSRERGLHRGVVDFGPRSEEPVAWSPRSPRSAPDDLLVASAFRHLTGARGLQPGAARELGRAMGRAVPDVEASLVAFSHLGLGRLSLAGAADGRLGVVGHGLAGSEEAHAASCALALGFVEGLAEAVSGRDALGAEMRCRSRGHETCSFVVRSR